MKITIESTPELAQVNGLPIRVWTGTTESGTPILALVTRLTVPEGADASELRRDLAEPPTRVRDADGEYIAAPRACTVCLARKVRRPATHVARDPSGLEWFECGRHDPTDNVAETVRVALEPIGAWFDRHERPLPEDGDAQAEILRTLASAAPWELQLYVSKSTEGTWVHQAAKSEIKRRRGGARENLRDALHRVGDAKVAELASECRSLRERLKAALAPERRTKTEAERKALNALHRWLHSPSGDCALTDEAQDFHTQVEAECAAECARLEEEERLAHGRLLRYGTEVADVEETTAEEVAGVCRVCGCTDEDCRQCITKTGKPCCWVEADLCSACAEGQSS